MKIAKYSSRDGHKSSNRLTLYLNPEEYRATTSKFGERFSLDLVLTSPNTLLLRPDSGGSLFGRTVYDGDHLAIGWGEHKLGDLLFKIPDMGRGPVDSWTLGPHGVTIIWKSEIKKPRIVSRTTREVQQSTQSTTELYGRIGACATQLQELLNQVPPNDEISVTWIEGKLGITMTERKIKKLF